MTFSHKGNIGDVIYSLPSMSMMGGGDMVLQVSKLMSKKFCEDLAPLLKEQTYVKRVLIDEQNKAWDVELDAFRRRPLQLHGGHIAMWYNHTTGVFPNIAKRWLGVSSDTAYVGSIIINRTQRYREEELDYSFLQDLKRPLLFWGSDAEYEEFNYFCPCERVEFDNYLGLAKAIKACHAFVGNTSFAYAIAEGLKVKRFVEVPQFSPNAFPIGDNGYQFSFQDMFVHAIKRYL